MKRSLQVLLGLFLLGNMASAQVLEGFGSKGSLGIFKDAAWGALTDSIYQTADPTNSANGVMGVAFDLKERDPAHEPTTDQGY
jgi:hypothetical protein